MMSLFQFLNGTIKSNSFFQPKFSQRQFQFLNGTIKSGDWMKGTDGKTDVSIPKWYN